MKNYVPTTLDQYVNESKSITLKRGYKDRQPVVVGANAPIRNHVLSYVAESKRVGAVDLKRFIAGLNETNENPNAAANMWLRRNGKFFVTESKGGRTFYKLSSIGQRLVNRFAPESISEGKGSKTTINLAMITVPELKKAIINAVGPITFLGGDRAKPNVIAVAKKSGYKPKTKLSEMAEFAEYNSSDTLVDLIMELAERRPEVSDQIQADIEELRRQYPDFDEELGEVEGRDKYVPELEDLIDKYDSMFDDATNYIGENLINEKKKYDFKDPKTGEPGIVDDEDEVEEGYTKKNESKELSEERKARIEKIIETIKTKKTKPLNEEDDEDKEEDTEGDGADELSFDDLDLSGEDSAEAAEGDEEAAEGDEEAAEGDEEAAEDLEDEGDDDKVEITEFIITVDDVDSAISELEELGVAAEKVVDPDGEVEKVEEDEGEEGEGEEGEGGDEAYKDDEISVRAEDWDGLKGWLEDKGVDVEEMFGGEIEVEDIEDEGEDLEGDLDVELEGDDLEGDDLEGGEAELELDFEDGEGSEELELDVDPGEDVEESVTGMEREEKAQTPNLFKTAKEITFKY